MLRVTAEGWWNPKYTVLDDESPVSPVAEFHLDGDVLMISGEPYHVEIKGWLRQEYYFSGELISALAKDTLDIFGSNILGFILGFFGSNNITIEHTGHSYILKKRSWFFSYSLVIQEDGEQLGTIWKKTGVFKIGAETDLIAKIPLEIRVFMLWLAFDYWSNVGGNGGGNGG